MIIILILLFRSMKIDGDFHWYPVDIIRVNKNILLERPIPYILEIKTTYHVYVNNTRVLIFISRNFFFVSKRISTLLVLLSVTRISVQILKQHQRHQPKMSFSLVAKAICYTALIGSSRLIPIQGVGANREGDYGQSLRATTQVCARVKSEPMMWKHHTFEEIEPN